MQEIKPRGKNKAVAMLLKWVLKMNMKMNPKKSFDVMKISINMKKLPLSTEDAMVIGIIVAFNI